MRFKASGRSALVVAAGIWMWCLGPLQAQQAPNAAAPATAQQTQPNPLQQFFGIKPAPAAAPADQANAEPGMPMALQKYRKASSHHSRRHRVSRTTRHPRRSTVAKSKPAEKADSDREARVADADNTSAPESSTPPAKSASPAQGSAPQQSSSAQLSTSVANARAQLLESNPAAATAPAMNPPPTGAPAPSATTAATAVPAGGENAAPPPTNTAKADTNVVPSDQFNDIDRAATESAQPTPTLALASMEKAVGTTGQAAAASDDHSTWSQASFIGKIFIAFGGLLTLASAARMFFA